MTFALIRVRTPAHGGRAIGSGTRVDGGVVVKSVRIHLVEHVVANHSIRISTVNIVAQVSGRVQTLVTEEC